MISMPAAAFTYGTGIHRYDYIVEDCTWSQAMQKAKDRGGYLAHIDSQDEYSYMKKEISAKGLDKIIFRVGGRRNSTGGEYYWVDTDNNPVGSVLNSYNYWAYTEWMKGEPSFVDGSSTETVIDIFYYKDEGRWVWNDVPDDILNIAPFYAGKVGYIVEYEDSGDGWKDGWTDGWTDGIDIEVTDQYGDQSAGGQLYSGILDQYTDAAAAGDTYYFAHGDSDFPDVNEGIMIMYYYYGMDIGYAFWDIDANGVDELLIGIGKDGDYEPAEVVVTDGSLLVPLFVDQKLSERNSLTIFTDGVMYVHMSDSAVHSLEYFFRIDDQNLNLKLLRRYKGDWGSYPDKPYSDGKQRISEKSFNTLLESRTKIDPAWSLLLSK